MNNQGMNIIMVGDVILSIDCLQELFCCDINACKGSCCIEGDAGAPVTEQEVKDIQRILDVVWDDLSTTAQKEIKKNGISYIDEEGDLVTSIVNGKDCVFTCYDKKGNCMCAIQKAKLEGKINVNKPISCSLYPIREKQFNGGLTGLNYHRWDVCKEACALGRKLKLPVYKFLKEPLIQRFGEDWYNELDELAKELNK